MRRGRAIARPTIWLALALVATSGCPREPVAPEGACAESDQCPDGWLCVDGACAKACNRNLDCPRRDQACQNGACLQVPDPACDDDADCRSPNDCQLPEGAACRTGVCVYASALAGRDCDDEDLCTERDACDGEGRCLGQRKSCDHRPEPACVESNSVYRSYAERGVCLPASGECSYAPFDVACAQCSITCLPSCAALSCDDDQGGCRSNGRCLPGATPSCVYDLADDDTACRLDSDPPGGLGGHCAAGLCSGCREDMDCTDPPGDDTQCFSASCQSAGCVYTARPGESCAAPFCRSGYLYLFPLCSNDGECLDGNRVSCNGLRCNAEGTACLTSCSGDQDCMPGAYCDQNSGRCEGLLDDGEDCSSVGSTQCLSGYCDGRLCCSGGDCCNQVADCPAGYSAAARCLDLTPATTCQGSGLVAACTSHRCDSAPVDDDSACAGLLHACPANLAPVACSAAAEQPLPTCPVDCSGGAACASGYQCDGVQCVRIPGVGDACTGTGQGSCPVNLKCENGVCCAATGAACCTSTTACPGGLSCDVSVASCRTGCTDFTSTACADAAGSVCVSNTCVPKLDRGGPCSNPAQCLSGFCASSVCCNDACSRDCEACRGSLTGGSDGTCTPRLASHVCRGSAGACDRAEACTGSSPLCPADLKSTAVCRPQSGDCDVADFCDGVSNACPTLDRVQPANHPCRAASGLCDLADTCDGVSRTCADSVQLGGTPCRAKSGVCDREDLCDGTSKACADDVEPSSVVCRPALHPICDSAESCNGGKDCPSDNVATWHSDCGVCDWCEGGQCVGNSVEHGDCGFCEKCQGGSCVGAAPGEDPRGNDCPGYDCPGTVAGWTESGGQGQCTAFTDANTAANGMCSGPGACFNLASSCVGSTVIATCANWSCARKPGNSIPEVLACQPGQAVASNDSAAEVCFVSGQTTSECLPVGPVGSQDFYECQAGGVCAWTYFSCPMLYSWNGSRFVFESDQYTAGYLGLKLAYGFRKPDPNDYYVLRHELVPEQGLLNLQLTEERWEIDFMDQVRLFAVDAPPGHAAIALANNAPMPYMPVEQRVLSVGADLQAPVSMVHLDTGRDVRPELSRSDGVVLQLSEDRNDCYWNTIEVDLGDLSAATVIKLIVDGKSSWPTTSAGDAHRRSLDPTGLATRMEVLDASGAWVEVPRTLVTLTRPKEFSRPMAIDISQVFLTRTYKLRLSWLVKTHMDAILLDTTPAVPLVFREAPLASADLHYRGFSQRTNDTDNFEYNYDRLEDKPPRFGAGAYTRYGEVAPLLDATDDMFVVFGSGDEVTLRFAELPPPAEDQRRQWVLYSSGYYKRYGSNYTPYTVAPLPFAAMSTFPYDEQVEHYPDDPAHQEYLSTWNTRVQAP